MVVTKRRFIVALTAIGAWAVVEALTQMTGHPGISMYGNASLVAIVTTYFGADALKAKFRNEPTNGN